MYFLFLYIEIKCVKSLIAFLQCSSKFEICTFCLKCETLNIYLQGNRQPCKLYIEKTYNVIDADFSPINVIALR